MPRISPEISDFHSEDFECCKEMMDDIFKEPVPPEMNEQAYEAIAEELKVAQVSVWYKKWKHVNNFIIKQVWA